MQFRIILTLRNFWVSRLPLQCWENGYRKQASLQVGDTQRFFTRHPHIRQPNLKQYIMTRQTISQLLIICLFDARSFHEHISFFFFLLNLAGNGVKAALDHLYPTSNGLISIIRQFLGTSHGLPLLQLVTFLKHTRSFSSVSHLALGGITIVMVRFFLSL